MNLKKCAGEQVGGNRVRGETEGQAESGGLYIRPWVTRLDASLPTDSGGFLLRPLRPQKLGEILF